MYRINHHSWIKLAYSLCHRCGYSIIFVNFPGFDLLNGRSLDQAGWKWHRPEIITAILSSFHFQYSVGVVAQCGRF